MKPQRPARLASGHCKVVLAQSPGLQQVWPPGIVRYYKTERQDVPALAFWKEIERASRRLYASGTPQEYGALAH